MTIIDVKKLLPLDIVSLPHHPDKDDGPALFGITCHTPSGIWLDPQCPDRPPLHIKYRGDPRRLDLHLVSRAEKRQKERAGA